MKKLLFSPILSVVILLICTCIGKADIIYPPSGALHPYIFINEEFKNEVFDETGEVRKEFSVSYNYIKRLADSPLPAQPEGGYVSSAISNQLKARALLYALGVYDDNHAKATVEHTIKYLEKPLTSHTYSISMYKDLGTNGIELGALVYDWCYKVLTDTQKQTLADEIMEIYNDTDGDGSPNYKQPCRPDNTAYWHDVAGKSGSQPLFYNAVAALALYDATFTKEFANGVPKTGVALYELMMGKIQGSMAAAQKKYGSAGAIIDGSISYLSPQTYYVYVMLSRLGASDEVLTELYGDHSALGYKLLYSRLPYGALIKQGDDSKLVYYTMDEYSNNPETAILGIMANIYQNSYFKFQYIKENYNQASIYNFLTTNGTVMPKTPDDLPLAYETNSPRSEIMVRTSWKDGITSPAVSAYMNMNERRSGDHDHANIGDFQLYYKGPLTVQGGVYAGENWGGEHWRNYYSRTVSSNCITVKMPGEMFKFGPNTAEANDGGQMMVSGKDEGYFLGYYDEHFSDSNLYAVKEGSFIGPNKKTPAFSYIKGDITKAYSADKMENYKRSMVFMDTFNETYPGIMIVFDRVVSKNASYEKKWLLQAVADPEISGNKVTIKNTSDGANGKLVNSTLLPENAKITEIGGIDTYISDGLEYKAPATPAAMAYRSGYRLEIEPQSENKEDIFLNAMFVADADTTAPDVQMIKEENNIFVGVTALDRTVLFSKNGNAIENEFSFTVRNNNGGSKMLCFISDLKSGNWMVNNKIFQAKEGEGCIVFETLPGNITVSPAPSSAVADEILWKEAQKGKVGDFAVKLNGEYISLTDETIIKDGVAYVSAQSAIMFGENILVNETGDKATINRDGFISEIVVGNNFYTYCDTQIALKNQAILGDEGKIYIPVCEMGTALAANFNFVDNAVLLLVESGSTFTPENVIKPQSVTGIERTQPLYDGVLGEKVLFSVSVGTAAPHRYTPICFYYGEEVKSINRIIFASNMSADNFEIMHSVDGINYYKIFGTSSEVESGIYALDFDTVLARYIKVIPNNTGNPLSLYEVAVCGKVAEKSCALLDRNITYFNKMHGIETSVYVKAGFENAKVCIGSEEIYTLTEDIGDVYSINIPSERLKNISTGRHTLSLLCTYNGNQQKDERDIYIVGGIAEREIASVDFSGSASEVFKNYTTNYASYSVNRGSGVGLDGGRVKVSMTGHINSGFPWFDIRNLKIKNGDVYEKTNNGTYTVSAEMEFSSDNIYVILEPRTKDITYPQTGHSYPLFYGKEGKYKVTLTLDTTNNIIKVYMLDMSDENARQKLIKEINFVSEGVGLVRFSFGSWETGEATVWVDNLEVSYTAESSILAELYEDESGDIYFKTNISAFPEIGNVKILKVIKKDGKLDSIDIKNAVAEEVPLSQKVDAPNGSIVEVYITSSEDILKIITQCRK